MWWQVLLAGILPMLGALIIAGVFIEALYERRRLWQKLKYKDFFRRLWIAGCIRRGKFMLLVSAIWWDIKKDIELFWQDRDNKNH